MKRKEIIYHFNFLMMLALCVFFISCKTARIMAVYDGLNDRITVRRLVNTPFMNVENDKIFFSNEHNRRVISCFSDDEIVAVSSDPSWCMASVDKIDGNTVIEIQVTRNNGQERTANIAVSIGKAEPARIEVKQESGVLVFVEGIPILAWYGVMEHTVERYRELKDAGISYNFSLHRNVEDLAKAMDAAKATGVKMIIHCPELFVEPENIVNRFKDHPVLVGYYLQDEPNCNDFPRLGELTRRIQAIDNKHFCYVNLFGDGAPSEYYGTPTYQEYIQLFIKEVPVQILSFDTYPIRINASGVRYLTDLYKNLEIFSNEARRAGKPFWAFALTTAHWSYPIPTLADLRLQVFSNLAYGAQGIQYFTYWTPTPYEAIDFHDGPIDWNTYKKTQTWYTVQEMNREIKGLSSVFLGAQVIKVEHIVVTAEGGDGSVPIGTTRFAFANRPAEAQIITKFTPANGTNAVVSFLKNGNRCYMVVINRNLEGGDNMSVTVEGGAGLQLIKKDGTAVFASSESSNQTITPGDALIYGWDY